MKCGCKIGKTREFPFSNQLIDDSSLTCFYSIQRSIQRLCPRAVKSNNVCDVTEVRTGLLALCYPFSCLGQYSPHTDTHTDHIPKYGELVPQQTSGAAWVWLDSVLCCVLVSKQRGVRIETGSCLLWERFHLPIRWLFFLEVSVVPLLSLYHFCHCTIWQMQAVATDLLLPRLVWEQTEAADGHCC